MVSLASGVGTISADNVTAMVGTILVPSKRRLNDSIHGKSSASDGYRSKAAFSKPWPCLLRQGGCLTGLTNIVNNGMRKCLKRYRKVIQGLADIAKRPTKTHQMPPIMLSEDQTLSHIMGLIEQGLVAKSAEGYRPTNH